MREIKYIVLHCSATKLSQNYTVEKLKHDHVVGNGWSDIGYHYYVTKDGTKHACRPEDQIGAHVKGFNSKSIGVCYEGGVLEDGAYADTRTAEQIRTLHHLLKDLITRYPGAEIVGHRDLLAHRTKACPCFDARQYYKYIYTFRDSAPSLKSGSYKLSSNVTPQGGSLWMNLYEGATSVSGGSSTTVKVN